MGSNKHVCLSLPPTLIGELKNLALAESFDRLYWVSYLDLIREAVAEKYGIAASVARKPKKGAKR